MPITHATVHHLSRSPDGEAKLSLRRDELPTEGYSDTLLDNLKSAFLGRISREHGSFSAEGEPAPLARQLEVFLRGESPFTEATAALMEPFRQAVDGGGIEIDVNCLFFVEQSPVRHLFYWFAARRKEALTVGEDLDVKPSYSLDTGSSLFGIKVDLAEWKERQHYSYLSLVAPRGNPLLAETFTRLTGFNSGLDKAEATMAFLEGVEAFSKQLPDEQVKEYRTQVVDYCMEQEQKDAPVDVRELAGQLERVDNDEFVRVVTRHTPDEEPEVHVDRRSLSRYVKFAGRERDLAISFASHQLDHRVHYDAENDTLRIQGLPSALKKQLEKHLKGD